MKEEEIKITPRSVYIFQGIHPSNVTEFFKFKIIEITEETYFIENMDSGCFLRIGISDFNNKYKPVEVLKDFTKGLDDFIKDV